MTLNHFGWGFFVIIPLHKNVAWICVTSCFDAIINTSSKELDRKIREKQMAAIKNITKFRNAVAKAGVSVNGATGYQSNRSVTVRDYDFFDANMNEVSHYDAKWNGAEPVWFTMFNITPEQQVKLFDAGFKMQLVKMRKHFGAHGEFVMETVYQAPTK